MRKLIVLLLIIVVQHHNLCAQKEKWVMEAEDPGTELMQKGDTLELIAPKGVTLWYNKIFRGNITIEYDAMVVYKDSTDRISDLNCFWMASDPDAPAGSIWYNIKERKGVFKNCYTMKLYYLGYGGNYNSTTRFRKYNGTDGTSNSTTTPPIIKEYTDSDHLLVPNHWYHIKISNIGNVITYSIDGEEIVKYNDPKPYQSGWFGFRTTLSHTMITNFRYQENNKPQ